MDFRIKEQYCSEAGVMPKVIDVVNPHSGGKKLSVKLLPVKFLPIVTLA